MIHDHVSQESIQNLSSFPRKPMAMGHASTWRIIPVSTWLASPIYKP